MQSYNKKIISAILALSITTSGIAFLSSNKSLILKSSPYDGNSITMSEEEITNELLELEMNLNDDSEEINLKKIENMDNNTKENMLLLTAILKNKSYSKEELRLLSGLIDYVNDDPYLNKEEIYKIIKDSKIKNNVVLEGDVEGVTINKKIYLENEGAIKHEIMHLINSINNNLFYNFNSYNGEFQRWFEEGFTQVLSYEYLDYDAPAYALETSVVRFLTIILGKDVMLQARDSGDLSIIVKELEEKGISKDETEELFKNLNLYSNNNDAYTKKDKVLDKQELSQLRKEIATNVANIYNHVYNSPEIVNPKIRELVRNISDNIVPINSEIYLFNSKKNNTFMSIAGLYNHLEEIDDNFEYEVYTDQKVLYYKNNNVIYEKYFTQEDMLKFTNIDNTKRR